MKKDILYFVNKISALILSLIILSLTAMCFGNDFDDPEATVMKQLKNELASQLMRAVTIGDAKTVRKLITEKNAELEIAMEQGRYTPLMVSIINNHKEVFDTLIELDPRIKNTVHQKDSQGYNVLFLSVLYYRPYMFHQLINLYPKLITSTTTVNETLLHVAAGLKRLDFLETLLEKKVIDLHQKTELSGENFLHYLFANPEEERPKTVQLKDLIKKDDGELDENVRRIYKPYKAIFFPQTLEDILNSKYISKADKVQLIQSENNEKRTLLHLLAATNNTKSIELFIKQEGAEIDKKDHTGFTPLAIAVIYGNEKSVKTLLDQGANIFTTDNLKREVYWYAFNNTKSSLKLFQLIGSHLSFSDQQKHFQNFIIQGLNEAIIKNKLDLLEYFIQLIESDNNIQLEEFLNDIKFSIIESDNTRAVGYASVMDLAIRFSNKEEIFELLLKKGFKLEFDEETGHHSFHSLIKKGNLRLVKLFYEHMSPDDLNVQTGDLHKHFLFTALNQDNLAITEFLLDKGANPNLMINTPMESEHQVLNVRMNLFTVALIRGLDLKFFKLLFKYGINPTIPDSFGYNALFWAIKKKRLDVFKYLVENMPKKDLYSLVNHINSRGELPLFLSVTSDKNIEFTRMMIEYGEANTDPFKEDPDRPSALEYAIIHGSEKNAQFLINHTKQNLNTLVTSGKRIFEYVITDSLKKDKEHASKMINWLLTNGADPNLKSKEGLNMLHLAVGLNLDINAVSLIVEKIHNVNDVIDKNRYTVGHIIGAKRKESTQLDLDYLELLESKGLDLNKTNKNAESVFQMISLYRPDIAKILNKKMKINKAMGNNLNIREAISPRRNLGKGKR